MDWPINRHGPCRFIIDGCPDRHYSNLMNSETKPGYATMAKVLRRDLAEIERACDANPSQGNWDRVVAVRAELSRVERGEL